MVLEYLEHDLQGIQQRIKQSPTKVFKIGDVKAYMLQLLKGLSAMHQKGILHRDLKAANLLVSKSGVLKIADFGLSRLSAKLGEAGGVLTPQVCTLWYRAPELLLAGCGLYRRFLQISHASRMTLCVAVARCHTPRRGPSGPDFTTASLSAERPASVMALRLTFGAPAASLPSSSQGCPSSPRTLRLTLSTQSARRVARPTRRRGQRW
jgi:serine/threonine protein kinase